MRAQSEIKLFAEVTFQLFPDSPSLNALFRSWYRPAFSTIQVAGCFQLQLTTGMYINCMQRPQEEPLACPKLQL